MHPAPEGLCDELVDDWNAIWNSALASAITDTSLPALRRLFHYRQQWFELKQIWDDLLDEDKYVPAMDRRAARVHPSYDRMMKTEVVIDRLEKALGLQPKAAADLGYVAAAAQHTWQQVAAGGNPEAVGPAPSALPVVVIDE